LAGSLQTRLSRLHLACQPTAVLQLDEAAISNGVVWSVAIVKEAQAPHMPTPVAEV